MSNASQHFDMIIIGAGFSGLYMLIKARELGLSVKVLETGSDVGGIWYWNRYPGARCDVESVEYSYSFSEELQQEWDWPERYSAQPDILSYLQHVAEKFCLREDIKFSTRVQACQYDAERKTWKVKTDTGDDFSAQFLVGATGPLSAPLKSLFEGTDSFEGEHYYTSEWPHAEVNFSGKRVAVIGTGSSGVQCIPQIAKQAAHLDVYQRTPAYAVPGWNRALTQQEREEYKADHANMRARAKLRRFPACANYPLHEELMTEQSAEERQAHLEKYWKLGGLNMYFTYPELLFAPETNQQVADFVREKIYSKLDDKGMAEKLMPQGILGAKRICVDSQYFEAYNQDNVNLIDVNETPIKRVTPKGIQASDQTREYDAIVFATGFDACTGALSRIDIRGLQDRSLKEVWHEGANNYLGMQVSGFPNFFTLTSGLGTPAALSNVIVCIEHQVEWIADCLSYMKQQDKQTINAAPEAEAMWVQHAKDVVDMTLMQQANSLYMGANVPGKQRTFMPYIGGFPDYVAKCADVARKGYEGFVFN
jgi:cyclohexanone monooxygenase